MADLKKSISFKVDEDTWQEFKIGLQLDNQTIGEWINHKIHLEIIKNRPKIRELQQRRKEWKRRFMNGEDV